MVTDTAPQAVEGQTSTQEPPVSPDVEREPLASGVDGATPDTPAGGQGEGDDQTDALELDLPDGWTDSVAAREWRAEIERGAEARVQQVKDRELGDLRARLEVEKSEAIQEATSGAIVAKVGEAAEQLYTYYEGESYSEPQIEAKFRALLRGNDGWAAAWAHSADEQVMALARQEGITQAGELIRGALPKGIADELAPAWESLSLRVRSKAIPAEQALTELVTRAAQAIKDANDKENAAYRDNREQVSSAAAERAGKPVPAQVAGRGRAKGALTRAALKTMSAEQIAAIPKEELGIALRG